MLKGTLTIESQNTVKVEYVNANGKQRSEKLKNAQLSDEIKSLRDKRQYDALRRMKVLVTEEGGKIVKVERDPQAVPDPPAPKRQDERRRGGPADHGRPRQGSSRPHDPRNQPARGDFHNPYNFVPALPRCKVTGDLGDAEPAGHHVFHRDRFSGVLRVKMTIQTPLVLPDSANAVDGTDGHKSFPVRLDADGNPYVPPTSVKGMLRGAYEAVTNSRLAVFPFRGSDADQSNSGHAIPLAYRMDAGEGLRLVPARIQDGEIQLMMGKTKRFPYWDKDRRFWVVPGPMYAAWLPRYTHGRLDGLKYPDKSLPMHRDPVTCWVVEVRHRSNRFSFWKVHRIFRRGEATGTVPAGFLEINGFVCITNANINRKHDERIFFNYELAPQPLPLTRALRDRWHDLVCNYQSIHEADLAERACRNQKPDEFLGAEPGRTAWSRHVYENNAEQLADGTLCYAMIDEHGQVTELFPVMISRRLFKDSPLSLLDRSLRPATSIDELSPADRVFGWVKQGGHGAYRGNVRVGPIVCETSNAVDEFGHPGLPLAILGQPKPQQSRFYVAANQNGDAQKDGLTKEEAGYCHHANEPKGLRGRKVYPHHRSLPADHWDNPIEDNRYLVAADSRHAREYIRHPQANDGQRKPNRQDNQNRSILGWVRPGTVFAFDLHITNLSRVEVGALLWLLSLPKDHYHRLGGGKPLGFGSVRLDLVAEETELRDGNGWKDFYSTLDPVPSSPLDHNALMKEFKDAVCDAYGPSPSFESISFIAAFLRMARGFEDDLPIHYPRSSQQPNPEGKNYKWFVANDRKGGPAKSLPDLTHDKGLPLLGD